MTLQSPTNNQARQSNEHKCKQKKTPQEGKRESAKGSWKPPASVTPLPRPTAKKGNQNMKQNQGKSTKLTNFSFKPTQCALPPRPIIKRSWSPPKNTPPPPPPVKKGKT